MLTSRNRRKKKQQQEHIGIVHNESLCVHQMGAKGEIENRKRRQRIWLKARASVFVNTNMEIDGLRLEAVLDGV